MLVEVKVIAVRPTQASGKLTGLVALADVVIEWGELSMEIRAVRIESLGHEGTRVRMPTDREGRAVMVLPDELSAAVAEVVLAGALEMGILKTRAA